MTIALVGDDSLNGLGIVRSLSLDSAVEVAAIARPSSVVARSRYVDHLVHRDDDADFVELVSRFAASIAPRRIVPFPASDAMVYAIGEAAQSFSNIVFLDPVAEVRRIAAKSVQYGIGDDVGVPVPTWVHLPVGSPIHADEVRFPMAVRPDNRAEVPTAAAPFKMKRADDQIELQAAVQSLHSLGLSAIVCAFVEGPEEQLYTYGGYASHGKVMADFVGRKRFHTYPTRVAAIAERANAPEVADQGRRFMQATHLSGLFQVEMKMGADGTPYLIEMNQRNWLWGELATTCGVNLPLAKFWTEAGEPERFRAAPTKMSAIYLNEYGIVKNMIGYRTLAPLRFLLQNRDKLAARRTALYDPNDRRPLTGLPFRLIADRLRGSRRAHP